MSVRGAISIFSLPSLMVASPSRFRQTSMLFGWKERAQSRSCAEWNSCHSKLKPSLVKLPNIWRQPAPMVRQAGSSAKGPAGERGDLRGIFIARRRVQPSLRDSITWRLGHGVETPCYFRDVPSGLWGGPSGGVELRVSVGIGVSVGR